MIVWSGSILLNTVGTAIGVKFCPDWTGSELDVVVVVKLIVAVIVAVFWNYIMQKYFVFSDLISKSEHT
jgi:putative flippase GtrA